MGTASEIVIWMVLAALVGFATGWALRSVVANRARTRLSERLEDKRREWPELREGRRDLRAADEDDAARTATGSHSWELEQGAEEELHEPHMSATAEHDE